MVDPAVLAELQTLALRRLGPLLAKVLRETDDSLFNLSQQPNASAEQLGFFEAMRELRKRREGIEEACRGALLDGFSQLRGRVIAPTQQDAAADSESLSLVDSEALEEQLACEHLAAAVERRCADAFERFHLSLARLLDHPELQPVANPIAAIRLAQMFRAQIAPVLSSLPARLISHKLLERVMLSEYPALLGELNLMLAGRGMLVEASATRRNADASPRADAAQPTVRLEPGATPGSPPQSNVEPTAVEPADQVYQAMRQMFSAYFGGRQSGAADGSGTAVAGRPAADPACLDSRSAVEALTAVQREMPAALLRAVDDRDAELGELLQQQLLLAAARLGHTRPGLALEERDEQALTLVGTLFDVLLDQGRYSRPVRERFVRLSVPYAKVALVDQRLFVHKAHPARRLLNALAEASEGNLDDSTADHELLLRVNVVIERLLKEFVDDPKIFVELEERFRRVLDQHQKRTALAERRTAETQRGRERLDDARRQAAVQLAKLVGDHPAPAAIGDFLRRYWTHHLAVTTLREGADSAAHLRATAAGVGLWQALRACEVGAEVPGAVAEQLRPMLASSGQSGESADLVIEQIVRGLRSARPSTAPAASTARECVHVMALDAPATTAAEGELRLNFDASRFDAADVERIRALKVGSWIEIEDAAHIAQAAKLSWVSPISQRLLFVNRRGLRLCALTPEEMAALMQQGKLKLRAVDSAFERAMGQMLGKLQKAPDEVAAVD